MHIAVFYQYHHNPDCPATCRHYTFLKHWAHRHRISLISTTAWQAKRITNDFAWVPPGVEAHLLPVPYNNHMNAAQRLRAFLRYATGAVARGLAIEKPDVIFGSSTPLTAAWAAATVARLRGVPWVFEVRDLWPDFPVQMGAVPPWLASPLYVLERTLYRSARHVICLSPDMEDHVRHQGIDAARISMLPQGTDFDLIDRGSQDTVEQLRAVYGLADHTIILYAGSYGRANDIPTLLDTARRLVHRKDLVFVFIGRGFNDALLREAARTQPNVRVFPPQPRHQVFTWFKMAALSLVPFIDRPVLASNAPSKFYDSLAVGTPVIVTNPGWTKDFVETQGCGWFVPPSSPDHLAACIDTVTACPDDLLAAGRRGAVVAREQFDRRAIAHRLEQIFSKVI